MSPFTSRFSIRIAPVALIVSRVTALTFLNECTVSAEQAARRKAENAKQQSEADHRVRSLNEIRVDVDMSAAEVRLAVIGVLFCLECLSVCYLSIVSLYFDVCVCVCVYGVWCRAAQVDVVERTDDAFLFYEKDVVLPPAMFRSGPDDSYLEYASTLLCCVLFVMFFIWQVSFSVC